MSYGTMRVSADSEALARDAAHLLCEQALAKPGAVRIALSGGSTPKRTYQLLAETPLRERFPWDRVHWYWGDERFVPPDDKDSNYGMTRAAMLDHVPAPADHIHPVPTTGVTAEQSAAAYEAELRAIQGAEPSAPLFDVCLLGLGEDGHTASLIPGEPVLQEREHWVAVVGHGRPEVRITLTYPAIDASALVVFLVSGAGKQAILARVRGGDATLPAARLHPAGTLLFLADKAAASVSPTA